jgi:hypothetical protein
MGTGLQNQSLKVQSLHGVLWSRFWRRNLVPMKICSVCKVEKKVECFSRKGAGHQSECKVCRSEYTKQHYLDNKEVYIARATLRKARLLPEIQDRLRVLKKEPCTDCKQVFPEECMDFDHIADDKIADVAELTQHLSWSKIEREIAKCQLVCSNCHRIRTAKRRKK